MCNSIIFRKPCFLCKRPSENFNIYTIYRNANTVRDNLVEILGTDSESYLSKTDSVCKVCMNMLDNLSKLKWKLWKNIVNENQDHFPVTVDKIWELFNACNREDEEDDGVSCRTPTPDSLVASHSSTSNLNFEKRTKIRECARSLSKSSSGVGRSDLSETSEITKILDKRRKNRKTPKYKSSMSSTSSRNNDRIFPRNEENEEGLKFYCDVQGCPLYFSDLDVLNHHKIIHHNVLALHYCDECNHRYTTAEHLNVHKKIHNIGPFWCILCHNEMRNQEILQRHLEQHAKYSVPCEYCDKSFISESLLENHIRSSHPDNKERVVHEKEIIIDRIDTFEVNESVEKNKKSKYRVFISPFTDVEYNFDEEDDTE